MIGIIPAAGKGIRFKELGKHYNKTILPYKEKPILIHQIEWLEKHGCNDIRIVLNHQEDTIKDILKIYNKNVSICRQEEQNGLSGAIFSALKKNEKEDCLILLGDLVVTDEVDSAMFEQNFISAQEVHDYSRWCMVKSDNGSITFFDKPQECPDTNLAVSGIYFIKAKSNLYKHLEKQLSSNDKICNEYQISTVLQKIANDIPMNIINIELIDFGTLEEYLQNRSIKNSRSFNDIEVSGPFVTKYSKTAREKIIKEYNWFSNLPDDISVYTPRIFSKDLFAERASYKMEKILAPSLREVYLFLDSTEETWNNIFDSMFSVLDHMKEYGQENSFMGTAVSKTKSRVKDIAIPIENKLVNEFIKDFERNIGRFTVPALMHGDFCFSNLLYDFQGNTIKMIDPRGELFGDHYYEVAKIMHSIIYDYDFIDAELYVKTESMYKLYNNGKDEIKNLFMDKLNNRYTPAEVQYIKLITASLFLSMIPLHSHNENNQVIFYDVFKKIYKEWNRDI